MDRADQNAPLEVPGCEQPELLAHAVLDAAAVCVLILGCDSTVQFANSSFYRTFQSGPHDTLGKHVCELENIHFRVPELRTLLEKMRLDRGGVDSVDIEHDFSELGYKALRITARRLYTGSGEEPCTLLTILDVTQQKCAEDELHACEDKYRTLADTTQDGIWTIDHSGITTFANPRMAAMVGTTPATMIGQPSFEYVFDDDKERAKELFGKKIRGDREPFEFRLRRADGSWFWVSAVGVPFHNASGECVGLLGTFRDITERKFAEDAALRYSDELARSTADLQSFAYVRSHDLREPLRTMRTYAQLMMRRYAGRLDSQADAFLEFIAAGADRLDKLLGDLLSYSDAVERNGSATRSKVDLKTSLDWAQRNLQTRISQAGAEIDSADLPTVRGDELQLVQLFQQLLSNSLKFRRSDEPPRVHISAELQAGEWIIAVSDNGVGIPQEHWDRIFGIFKRLHGRDIPGTGIGLAICRKIAESHRGRIWVDSEPGRGATFFFSVPADEVGGRTPGLEAF